MSPMQRPAIFDQENHEASAKLQLVPSLLSEPDPRDDFISLASHELKTPLTALLLEVELYRRQLKKSEQGEVSLHTIQQCMKAIDRHAWQLNRVIEDMLDSTKLSHGSLELHKEPANLEPLIESVVSQHAKDLASSGSHVTLKLDSAIIGFWDRARLGQVIEHLFINAIKYGAGQEIQITTALKSQEAMIQISDLGIGIPSDSLERIFGRFERANSAEHISGLGLGLYISRKIVELHGGKIWAESNMEQGQAGSKFTVVLPLNTECVS